MLAADGALSLKVTSTGTPFRILSPHHGIYVNADACAFQSLLLKAVLSHEPEEFQDNLSHSARLDATGRESGALPGSETTSVVCGRGPVRMSRAAADTSISELGKGSGQADFRAGEKALIWRIRNAAD
ncbi:MAG: hypothetical protein AAFY05_15505 [Pseudomonadota bacterium]